MTKNTYREVPVWVKSGVLLAIAPEIETAVERRWDKSGNIYVNAKAGMGATRMQEKKVARIFCSE